MKKSEAYRKSIKAVIECEHILLNESVDVLDVLFADYRLAKFSEEQEEKEVQA